ncbi:MAG: excinuclease ABC subunit A, partial [Cytophagales bacterium]
IKGIHHFFNWVLSQEKNTQFRILYASYYGKTTCRACNGGGLRKEVSYVKINQKSIVDLLHMQIDELDNFLATLTFPAHQKKAADILVSAIKNRVYYLKKVGLGYLSLNRFTATLSGGEYQRARLAKILGSPLVDSLYVLEGISVGLHQHNILPIIEVLLELTDLGNTAVVIGQEESIMRAASTIIDVGPEAGEKGGKIVFQGPWEKLLAAKNSYTADYLAGRRVISVPAKRRPWTQKIELHNIQKNNFKDIHVTFPLNVFVIVTGVSGSGKSTLVEEVLYDSLRGYLKHAMIATRPNSLITGDLKSLKNVKYIQQGVPSKSSRSNVATYVKVFDTIRKIFMEQDLSKSRGYTITDFSFNTSGGRCETCAGEGTIKIDMQIMDDVMLTCQDCQGKQFQEEILEVTYKGKNIIQILDMTISQSLVFFEAHPLIMAKLKPLADLGLGELKIGQPSNTLSSGETQKLKLAQAVPDHRNKMEPTLFIFDEPSSDLHFHDIEKCIQLFRKLLDKGHSVVVIDHHMDMIKSADWIIDVGPDAGEKGGEIIFEGTPEAMLNASNSHTAHHLRIKIARDRNLIKTDEA